MSSEDCLTRARAFATGLRAQIVDDGTFYRNLPKEQVAKRYNSDHAEFGYRIKCGKWTNSLDGLSVNHSECCTARCSIALGGRGEPHVAELRIKELATIIGIKLYARHDPIGVPLRSTKESEFGGTCEIPAADEPRENPCHFLILPKDQPPEDLVAALARLEEEIPKERPRSAEERERFEQVVRRQSAALILRRDLIAR